MRNIHLRHLRYLLRHKWCVFVACRQLHVPLWQAITHDLSAFSPAEWAPVARYCYESTWWDDKRWPQDVADARARARLHHQHHNPHHWQHWLLKEDGDTTTALEMPERYAIEMVADWIGAGQAARIKTEVRNWYDKNKGGISLHPNTRKLVEKLIDTYRYSRTGITVRCLHSKLGELTMWGNPKRDPEEDADKVETAEEHAANERWMRDHPHRQCTCAACGQKFYDDEGHICPKDK